MRSRSAVAMLFVLALAASEVAARTWTDNTGEFSVEAEFVGLEGGQVQLLKPDGAIVKVPLERFSPEDRQYVAQQASSGGTARAAGQRAVSVEPVREPDSVRRWAILIGVNEYQHLNDLRYCQRDVEALRDQLFAVGFDKDNVVLLADGAAESRYLPFKSNIERQLEITLRLAEPPDVMLVALSGHGLHLDDESYFCPLEARLEDAQGTLVSLKKVYEQLEACPAQHKLLVVDACRNDPRPPGRKDAVSHEKSVREFSKALARPPAGILALSSCAAGQVSWEDDGLRQGVFMHYVLQGLSGEADREEGNTNGEVSLLELYKYANLNTKRFVARKNNDVQTPELYGRLPGDWDITPAAAPASPREITNSIGMKLVLIPAGEFMMGSGESAEALAKEFDTKAEFFEDEYPQHKVTITRPFYLGVHEVTVGQFRRFVEAQGYKTEPERDGEGGWGWNESEGKFEGRDPKYNWRNTGFEQTDAHPVLNVTWNDAVAFCEWLGRTEGHEYRLPTEAEWEYACRAGTTTRWWFGDEAEGLAQVANVADATAKSKFDWGWCISGRDGHAFTAPVGSFRANAWGLHDMHGNVWEWCADWYEEGYYSASPAVDPKGPDSTERRVLRGGSWNSSPRNSRSADRAGFAPGDRGHNGGFRLARTP